MAFKDNFSNDKEGEYEVLFTQKDVPIFQNKVYVLEEEAKQAEIGNVLLVQSKNSGFIYNKNFNAALMNYDANYNNEQANSVAFQTHLDTVLQKLLSFGIKGKKVVEVGCGKAVFFEKMLREGIDCIGFDPTYEGNNPAIIKDYFSEKYNQINADVIIMRHTLEHIPEPFSFLHTIAKANNYRGNIFIEVPTFDWIKNKQAFWDIFYEHCNYFTEESLSLMFNDTITGNFFGGQYIYLWGDLSKLKNTIALNKNSNYNVEKIFNQKFEHYQNLLSKNNSAAVWGAGAKGSTFLNLLDKEMLNVQYVIDINPAKQNKFIARVAHKINAPSILETNPVENIIVMNENYLEEIKAIIKNKNIKLYNL